MLGSAVSRLEMESGVGGRFEMVARYLAALSAERDSHKEFAERTATMNCHYELPQRIISMPGRLL